MQRTCEITGHGAELAGAVVVAEDVVILKVDLSEVGDRGLVARLCVHRGTDALGSATCEVATALLASVMLAWSG